MRVGAAHAEAAHRPQPPSAARPFPDPLGGGHLERAAGQVDTGVRLAEVRARRHHGVLQGQHHLEEAGDAGGRVQMPGQGLDRAQGAPPVALGVAPGEGLGERRELDRVAQRRGGAVRLQVADVGRVDPGEVLGGPQHGGLALDAGRGEPDLAAAVVVEGGGPDHGVHLVAGRERGGQRLEHCGADAVAAHGARAPGVEGQALAVGGEDAVPAPVVEGQLRQAHRGAPRHRDLAVTGEQGLTGEVDRDQGGRAGGLHRQRRTGEVQVVGHPGGQGVGHIAEQLLLAQLGQARIGQQMADQIGAQTGPGVDAGDRPPGRGAVAGPFQGGPGALQEDPLLGVEQLGLAGAVAEERRVEELGPVQHPAGEHGGRGGRSGRGAGARIAGAGGRFGPHGPPSGPDDGPEPVQIGRPGEGARHADHRDVEVTGSGGFGSGGFGTGAGVVVRIGVVSSTVPVKAVVARA